MYFLFIFCRNMIISSRCINNILLCNGVSNKPNLYIIQCVTMDIIINHARSNVGIAWMGNHVTKKTGRAQWVASPITSNLFARVCIHA